LNLKYLQSQFVNTAIGRTPSYSDAVNGSVYGGQTINFTSTGLSQIASEMALDQDAHVVYLRGLLNNLNRPNLNIGGGNSSGAFTQAIVAAARLGGLNNDTANSLGDWNPYQNQNFFLASLYGIQDTVVAAERDILPRLSNGTLINAVSGMLASDSYHAGQLRGDIFNNRNNLLAQRNINNNTVNFTLGGVISNLTNWINNNAGDQNNNVNNIVDSDGNANIVPGGSSGFLTRRPFNQIRSIVMGGVNQTQGLFFPTGFIGNLNGISQNL